MLPSQRGFTELTSEPGIIVADKTKYMEQLDKEPNWYYIFLRPRRWGKSTFLQTLADYYNKWNAEHFDEIFCNLYIGKHPTPYRSKYLVLRFEFSNVSVLDSWEGTKLQFHDHLNSVVKAFLVKNHQFLKPVPTNIIDESEGTRSLDNTLVCCEVPLPFV
jgi:hypothetical protein